LAGRLRLPTRPPFFQRCHRRGRTFRGPLMRCIAPLATAVLRLFMPRLCRYGSGCGGLLKPGDGLAGELFDRGDRLLIERSHDSDGDTAQSRATGAADAMDVVIGMVR